ncbi:MAG TPA: hypothetical protein VG371_05285 [Solirubrobacteraceae bacterium]|nr:hypothetical protein [Solirubrobacteraceae bacterium]
MGALLGVVVIALLTAAGAQALTLSSVDNTAALAGSAVSAAASLASTARSLAAPTAAAISLPSATSAGSTPAASGPAAAGGGSPAPASVPTRARPLVEPMRTTISGSSSGGTAAEGSLPANPVPTGATHPQPVAASSLAQDTVSALQRAGLTSGRSGSDPVPTTATPPWPVAGAGGPNLGSEIISGSGRVIGPRVGFVPGLLSALDGSSGRGAAALSGPAGKLLPVLLGTPPGPGRGSAGPGVGARAGASKRLGELSAARRPRQPLLLPASGPPPAAQSSAGRGPAGPVSRRRASARRSVRRGAAGATPLPATPAPLVPAPVPAGVAAAAGLGTGLGGTAVVLFVIAAIWLLHLLGGRIPLEATAWRETLLSLRLERPG